jgi:hypothetical protein
MKREVIAKFALNLIDDYYFYDILEEIMVNIIS